MSIFSDFTSFSLLLPVPDEVAGGLSGSSVKVNAEKKWLSSSEGAAEWKGNYSLHTLWHQVPVPSEMRISCLWMELCSPPAGKRGCIFFSPEAERKVLPPSLLTMLPVKEEKPGFTVCFAHRFFFALLSSFLHLLMHLSILVIRVWLKQQPDSTIWAWEVQVSSVFSG